MAKSPLLEKNKNNKAISMMRGKSPRSDVEMTKKNFRGGHLGFLTGISQLILTKIEIISLCKFFLKS